jgi:ABC-type multidrug transport system fused ATPase/permease subunit
LSKSGQKIWIRKGADYTVGVILTFIGVLVLLFVLWWWVTWNPPFPDLLTAEPSLFGIELPIALTLMHYTIAGFVFLLVGSVVWAAKRKGVPLVEQETVLLYCPSCKANWQEPMAKAQLQSMGYPKTRSLSGRKCPECAKFIRPKILKTVK